MSFWKGFCIQCKVINGYKEGQCWVHMPMLLNQKTNTILTLGVSTTALTEFCNSLTGRTLVVVWHVTHSRKLSTQYTSLTFGVSTTALTEFCNSLTGRTLVVVWHVTHSRKLSWLGCSDRKDSRLFSRWGALWALWTYTQPPCHKSSWNHTN